MSLVNDIGSRGVGAEDMFPADMLGADKGNYQKETVGKMFSQLLKEKKAECLTKIQSGSTEPSFQIGAGSYTETEWKKLLAGFDVAQAKLREAAEETTAVYPSGDKEIPDFVENMCYTSEEAFRTFFNHRKVDENKQPGHTVINRNHLDQYYAKHPGEIGKRNHYYNGRWYSMAELMAVWDKELAELFGQD